VFVDSSYWVGLADSKDQWHPRARELVREIRPDPRVLDLTVSEAITIVGSRQGGKKARDLYQVFLDSCDVIFLDRDLLDSAMELHLAHDGRLSLADCATIRAMARTGDRSIVSFDSDFDTVRGINRIH
jgi:predicted nucleic acid-binding protein